MNKLYLAIILGVFLTGCETTRSSLEPVVIKESIQAELDRADAQSQTWTVPDDVNAELLPGFDGNDSLNTPVIEPRMDVAAKSVSARQFFGSLLKGTKYNLIVSPDVSGRITVALNDVTIAETMDAVADMYGYDIQRQGNTYRINGAGLRTEIIPMNYLLMKRNGLSNSSISSGYLTDSGSSSSSSSDDNDDSSDDSSSSSSSSAGTEISTQTDTDYWAELENTLLGLTANEQNTQVVISPQAGLVTVYGYPKDIRKIKDFLTKAEEHLQRQVLLEVKIMEVTLNDGYEQGIDWNVNNSKVATDSSFNFSVKDITDIASGGGVLTLAGNDFSAAIKLLKTQGDVNVLSSPRVTALNNQKAVIKVGRDEYFVTGYSTTTSTESNTVDQDVDLTPFFSGIALDVTPQIDSDGGVLLHVHPSIIEVTDSIKTISGSKDIVLPLAKSDVRETDTVVKAKSGEIIVIGGLMKTANKDLVSKVPFLGDIPWLGELFTHRSQSVQKTELIILIKPVVVDQNTWRLELERSAELLEQWYPTEQKNEKG
ncbi:pilus (MSHA type) biogenesis protein MshL [Moritella viscosa]|uniref:MSHA biogenesis protein MshL n=1 Tax=Moritella viscosa TaxID=80854 RepID=A0A090IHH7_9GAMM|nr:pilus (MSHA type) biogenesis protein MshL [Moritella viscosa]CED62125.1 type IV pilus, mannose-sensitive hemagglutinin D (MSHD) [Moritella viscosa]SGY92371.1 Putative MSHA biogenesis protein MshL [Moritella viscosa]SGZ02630.1 Putative MSHA biogenesis protein MshL [Moritella viscosa]SGZ03112.1 Putative MSHA biogenesis protein MshL [Moritella viscosa]SHO07316.1 Putative MSHA biogenesis protein MshL [Moritella viscosa]